MSNTTIKVKPEYPIAIYDAVKILMNRGYIHHSKDVEIVRPGYESIFPCSEGSIEGPLKLNQLQWAVEKGEFHFCWYPGSYLCLKLKKGKFTQEITFDPVKQDVWIFLSEIDSSFQ